MAETVREAQERCAEIMHAPGFRRIGGAAYFVWAYPPKGGGTAHRHRAEQRRTPSTLTTSRKLLVP
jgi:hypothetical protein